MKILYDDQVQLCDVNNNRLYRYGYLVVVALDNGLFFPGLAILNPKESNDPEEAHNIAMIRAIEAARSYLE